MDQSEKIEPDPCLAIDLKLRVMLGEKNGAQISEAMDAHNKNIREKVLDKKNKRLLVCMMDGSILILGKDIIGVVDPQMVQHHYIGVLSKEGGLKGAPDMNAIRKQVTSKLAELKRRTRGENS